MEIRELTQSEVQEVAGGACHTVCWYDTRYGYVRCETACTA